MEQLNCDPLINEDDWSPTSDVWELNPTCHERTQERLKGIWIMEADFELMRDNDL